MSACVSCKDPLVLGIDEDGNAAPVPDDLLLACGCHFHWQCFLDSSSDVVISLKCPSCGNHLATNAPGPSVTNTIFPSSQDVAIVTQYHSEGGIQDDYNILPDVTEEAYLSMHPEARPAHAFHEMCAENNVEGILSILHDLDHPDSDDEEDGPRLPKDQMLRYQDPLNGNKSALHVAVEKDQPQVALLLLYLASSLDTDNFPPDALEVAVNLQLQRPTLAGPGDDIRALKDSQGRTAEEYAYQAGPRWVSFIEAGMFA